MRSDKLEKAKQLVGASMDQAEATSYAPSTTPEPVGAAEPPTHEPAPAEPDSPESTVAPLTEPDSKPPAQTATAYGFVIPSGIGQELVQLGVRIPADLRAALRTCSMMQQVEIQEMVRDALERELRRRAKA